MDVWANLRLFSTHFALQIWISQKHHPLERFHLLPILPSLVLIETTSNGNAALYLTLSDRLFLFKNAPLIHFFPLPFGQRILGINNGVGAICQRKGRALIHFQRSHEVGVTVNGL